MNFPSQIPRNGGLQGDGDAVADHAHMLGRRGLREGAHGWRGWAPGPAKDAGEREGGLVPVCGGERSGLSPANGNRNGIYGPNLQSTPRSGVGVNHFDIKIYVSWAKD